MLDETPETGLHYMRQRHYDARLARFLSPDPIGYSGGLNQFAYVDNNPINFTDPSGLSAWSLVGWAAAGAAVAIGGGLVMGAVGAAAVMLLGGAGSMAGGLLAGTLATAGVAATGIGLASVGSGVSSDGSTMSGEQRAFETGSLLGGFLLGGAVKLAGAFAKNLRAVGGRGPGGLRHPKGCPVSKGASNGINVTAKGFAIMTSHLRRFISSSGNQAMMARIQAAMDAGQRIFGADANFYLHEIAEATLMNRGKTWRTAHKAVLKKYNVHDFAIYAEEVVNALPEEFNHNWRNYWK